MIPIAYNNMKLMEMKDAGTISDILKVTDCLFKNLSTVINLIET